MLSLAASASPPEVCRLPSIPARPEGGERTGGAGSWRVLRRKSSEAAPVLAALLSARLNLAAGGTTRCVAVGVSSCTWISWSSPRATPSSSSTVSLGFSMRRLRKSESSTALEIRESSASMGPFTGARRPRRGRSTVHSRQSPWRVSQERLEACRRGEEPWWLPGAWFQVGIRQRKPQEGDHPDGEKLGEGVPARQDGPEAAAGRLRPRTPPPAGQRLRTGGRSAGLDHRRDLAGGHRGGDGDQCPGRSPAGAVGKETQRRRRVTPGFEGRVASNGGGSPDLASWYGNGAAVRSVRSTETVQQNSGRHGHAVTPLPGMHGLCPAPFRGRSRRSWTAQPGMP